VSLLMIECVGRQSSARAEIRSMRPGIACAHPRRCGLVKAKPMTLALSGGGITAHQHRCRRPLIDAKPARSVYRHRFVRPRAAAVRASVTFSLPSAA
jgi:hypothetical protein